MTNRIKVNLAWFALISLLFIGWATKNIVPLDALENPYTLKAEFASSLGMQDGNEVAYLGVKAGSVSSVRRIPGGVLVSMRIDRDKRIPKGSTAHLFRKSAIGEQYIDFTPPPGYKGGDGPWLAKNERIPMARTTVPLEFSELLRSASRLISEIDPKDVQTLVSELAIGLQGRTDSLRALTEAGDTIGQTLADRTEVLDRLATNNTKLTRVVTAHRGSLGDSLSDLRQLADSLKNSKGDLSLLLDRGSALLGQTADIVAANKGNLDCSLKVLERVVDATTTPAKLDGLRTLLQHGADGFGRVWDARDVEPDGSVWVRVGLVSNDENKAPQYVPPHQVPPEPDIGECESALRPAGGDYVPLSMQPASSMRSAGNALLLVLLLAFLVGGAVLRETGRLRSGA